MAYNNPYGAPPPGAYGGPPQQYGGPPPQYGGGMDYGVPAYGQYIGPPQAQGYGPPPGHYQGPPGPGYGPPGTVYAMGPNPDNDCARGALCGCLFGIFGILCRPSYGPDDQYMKGCIAGTVIPYALCIGWVCCVACVAAGSTGSFNAAGAAVSPCATCLASAGAKTTPMSTSAVIGKTMSASTLL